MLLKLQQNKLHRLYFNQKLSTNDIITPSSKQIVRLKNVLRLKESAELILFNGDGKEYLGIITFKSNKSINIIKELRHENINKNKIVLAQSIPSYKYMDFAIQKSVELGIDEIIPIISQRSHPGDHTKKMDHWKKVIIHAVEQSGGLYIPILSEPLSLEDLFKDRNYDKHEKILCDPSGLALSNINRNNFPKIIIVGPEGGFSDRELNLARTFNWNIVTLGDRILRTETAAIVAQVLLRG